MSEAFGIKNPELDSEIQEVEVSEEGALRPDTLDEFIGQKDLRENLRVFVNAAKARGSAMDHVLFFGPPGLGKTTLAQIVAKELGVGFRATSGPVIAKSGDLAAILTNLQPHDVLFIDEIHRLNPAVEEILYPAMEDGKLDLMIGEGPAARSIQIELPPFTLVGATTRIGLLTNPLRDRFGIPLRLDFYNKEELSLIISRLSRLLDISLEEMAAQEIAKRSRGTPRIAGRLTRRVRDFFDASDLEVVSVELVDHALSRLDVDGMGLDRMDRRYLSCIGENYGGGPVGVETIAAALSEQRDMIEDVIEPFLMQQGLVQRTPRGRMLSAKGFDYMGISRPKVSADQMDLLNDND
ncbi:MAG: Holliday junction branch migration DNA helicase RuvB [Alphaproteobacteria bacterium]|nr:Holliday junction branch migration DNA helicase RuvB [Alphaproteobacteria bacterium]